MANPSLRGFCTPFTPLLSSLSRIAIKGGLKDSLGVNMASYYATTEHKGVKLFLKIYSGKYARILNGRTSIVWEVANRITRLAAPDARNLSSLVKGLIEHGVAAPLASCHAILLSNGVIQDKVFVLVYPHVEGLDIYEIADRFGGMIPLDEARRIYCELVKSATLIESAGVVHGDLNPTNVKYVGLGAGDNLRAVILDFDGSIPKRLIRERGMRPAFYFNIDDSDIVFKVAGDLLAPNNAVYMDYAHLVYDGLEVLSRTEAADVVEKADFTKPVRGGEARALADALGERYVEHLNRVIEANFNGLGISPVRRLLNDLRGDGVCK